MLIAITILFKSRFKLINEFLEERKNKKKTIRTIKKGLLP